MQIGYKLKPDYIERLERALEQRGVKFNNIDEFDKYFEIEEPKKSTEYKPEPELLTDNEIFDLSSNCIFGLEYIILKTEYDRLSKMLEGGIKFAEIMIQAGNAEAIKIKEDLKSLLQNKNSVSEVRIREIQHFMNTNNEPYLRRHFANMNKRRRRGCFG